MIYLASPYTHPDPDVMLSRVAQSAIAAGQLMQEDYHIYSPLVHCHSIASAMKAEKPYDFWISHCLHILETCNHLVVLPLQGWKTSKGVALEVAHAWRRGIPLSVYQDDNNHLNKDSILETITNDDFHQYVLGIIKFDIFKPLKEELQ